MDEMALLERFRSDVEVDTAALVRSRRRVLRQALAKSVVVRRRRRLVLAAAAALTAIAVTMTVTGGPKVAPAAAAVLTRAADAANDTAEPGPGEYLHVREVTTRWYGSGAETTTQERWIPGDSNSPRVFRDFEGFVYLNRSPLPDIYRRPGLSTEALLEWLRRPNGDLRDDDAAYERVGEVLASDTAPLGFQAALFTALQSIEGVQIVDEQATFDGRDAVIIGRGEPLETQFAFDEQTGRLIGMQGVGDPDTGSRLSYRTVTKLSLTDRLPPRATATD